MSDGWYPPADAYWVSADAAGEYPWRYGDVIATPDLAEFRTNKGQLWQHIMVLHPSCELGAKAVADTQVVVARVNRVTEIGAQQRAAVRVGFAERDGELLIAHANTFWMPPLPGQEDDTDFYADFRRTQRVALGALRGAGREATMTHDARVYLIRREIYFRYRWLTAVEEVRQNEAGRIAGDPQFVGPRPDWAK